MYKVEGKIIYLSQRTSGVSKNGNSWSKRSATIECFDERKSKMSIVFFGNIEGVLTENYDIDDVVSIDIDINANEFNDKWYNNIYAKDIQLVRKHGEVENNEPRQDEPKSERSAKQHEKTKPQNNSFDDSDEDDLPF